MNEDGEKKLLTAQLRQMEEMWQGELAQRRAREALLESELLEVKACLANTEKSEKREADLRRKVKTADTLIAYLKSKARIMAIPRFAFTSCGIKSQEGVGLVDKKGIPMADWCKDVNLSPLKSTESRRGEKMLDKQGCLEQGDEEYIEQIVKAVMLVTDVMEVLLKRAIMAEAEMDVEKEKVKASQDEVKKKALQIESMWARVEDTYGMIRQVFIVRRYCELTAKGFRCRLKEDTYGMIRQVFIVMKSLPIQLNGPPIFRIQMSVSMMLTFTLPSTHLCYAAAAI